MVPGEWIGSVSQKMGVHTFSLEDKMYSDVLGIKNDREDGVSVVPLKGKYVPMEGDMVIGVVRSERFAGYDVDINSFYHTFVLKKDLRDPLEVGRIVSAKVFKVNELNEADIGLVHPLAGGELVSVTPARVPRIIGKNSSMLNVVKNGTDSIILVGKNGLVWLNEGNVSLAKESIQLIEDFAFVENLTKYMQNFLAGKIGSLPDAGLAHHFSGLEERFYRPSDSFSERGSFSHSRPRSNFRQGFSSRGSDRFSNRDGRSFGNRNGFDNRNSHYSNRNGFHSSRNSYPRHDGRSRFNSGRNNSEFEGNRNEYHPQRINRSFSSGNRRPFVRKRVRGDEDPVFE